MDTSKQGSDLLHIFLCILWSAYAPLLVTFSWVAAQTTYNFSVYVFLLVKILAPISTIIVGTTALVKRCTGVAWQNQSPVLQATAIFTISFLVGILLTYAFVASGISTDYLRPTTLHTFEFLPLEWLVNTIAYMDQGLLLSAVPLTGISIIILPIILFMRLTRNKQITKHVLYIVSSAYIFFCLSRIFALSSGAKLTAWLISTPLIITPIILLILLIRNKPIAKHTFYILTAMSTLGMLVLSCTGIVISSLIPATN